jgi:hypothetical protein
MFWGIFMTGQLLHRNDTNKVKAATAGINDLEGKLDDEVVQVECVPRKQEGDL